MSIERGRRTLLGDASVPGHRRRLDPARDRARAGPSHRSCLDARYGPPSDRGGGRTADTARAGDPSRRPTPRACGGPHPGRGHRLRHAGFDWAPVSSSPKRWPATPMSTDVMPGSRRRAGFVAGLRAMIPAADSTIGVYSIATAPDARRTRLRRGDDPAIVDDAGRRTAAMSRCSRRARPGKIADLRTDGLPHGHFEYDAYCDPPDPA